MSDEYNDENSLKQLTQIVLCFIMDLVEKPVAFRAENCMILDCTPQKIVRKLPLSWPASTVSADSPVHLLALQ